VGWLTEPFTLAFMRSAVAATLLVAATCAVLGAYVVLRGMAFAGDALAHTTLPGLVVAYLNGWSLFGGALAAGLVAALGIGWLSRRQALREDTAIGILFTGLFASGIALISTTQSYRDLSHMLFGNVLGVTDESLVVIVVASAVVLCGVLLSHRQLELTTVDPLYARIIGMRPDLLRALLLVLLSLAVIAGVQTVGVVLVSALLITPAATASLLTRRMPVLMGTSVLVAVGSGFAGLYASYYLNVASGAAIVLACTTCFGLVWSARLVLLRVR